MTLEQDLTFMVSHKIKKEKKPKRSGFFKRTKSGFLRIEKQKKNKMKKLKAHKRGRLFQFKQDGGLGT